MTLHASTNKAVGPSSFALGLGLTNECNLACAFCYRDPARTDRLDLGGEILAEDAFIDARSVPKACLTCAYLPSCRGGCAGRRRLLDQLDQPDPYCPIIRGERRPLRITLAEGRTLAKSDSACTTVVMARSS